MEKYSASFGSLKALSEDESQTKSELSAKAFFELSKKNFFVKNASGKGNLAKCVVQLKTERTKDLLRKFKL